MNQNHMMNRIKWANKTQIDVIWVVRDYGITSLFGNFHQVSSMNIDSNYMQKYKQHIKLAQFLFGIHMHAKPHHKIEI